jgi:hypothetical protein
LELQRAQCGVKHSHAELNNGTTGASGMEYSCTHSPSRALVSFTAERRKAGFVPARTKSVLGERCALDEDHVVHGGIRGRARDVVEVRPVVRLCVRQALSARTASAGRTRDAVVAFRGVWRPKGFFAPGRAVAIRAATCHSVCANCSGRRHRAGPGRSEAFVTCRAPSI